jgi:hypothetical protein
VSTLCTIAKGGEAWKYFCGAENKMQAVEELLLAGDWHKLGGLVRTRPFQQQHGRNSMLQSTHCLQLYRLPPPQLTTHAERIEAEIRLDQRYFGGSANSGSGGHERALTADEYSSVCLSQPIPFIWQLPLQQQQQSGGQQQDEEELIIEVGQVNDNNNQAATDPMQAATDEGEIKKRQSPEQLTSVRADNEG